jgi:hypothetical protein
MAHNKPRLLSVLLLALVRPVTPLRAPAAAPRALLGHVRPAAPVPSSLRLGSAPTLLASKKEDTAPIVDIADPNVSIVFGSALLLLLVVNRLFGTDDLGISNQQSRADIIAFIAPTVLVLEALTRLDITPKEADVVPLDGSEVAWVDPSLPEQQRRDLEWATSTLTSNLPASSLAVLKDGQTIALRGTLPASVAADPAAYGTAVAPGPLLQKCMDSKNGAPEYLPSLQILPGRFEFAYMPAATQALLMVPLPGSEGAAGGAIILGAAQARAFKGDDVSWARTVALGLGAF